MLLCHCGRFIWLNVSRNHVIIHCGMTQKGGRLFSSLKGSDMLLCRLPVGSLCGLYYDVDTSVDAKGEGHYGADYTYDLS